MHKTAACFLLLTECRICITGSADGFAFRVLRELHSHTETHRGKGRREQGGRGEQWARFVIKVVHDESLKLKVKDYTRVRVAGRVSEESG